jgi:two-component system cell cycle response regulator DivK
VDDLDGIREVWRRVLDKAGFDVVEATNGADGVREAKAVHPDVVLMDVTMPVLDGLSAVRMLKSDPDTACAPIIVITGECGLEGVARAAGCDAFLTKPVPHRELLATVRRVLDDDQDRGAS